MLKRTTIITIILFVVLFSAKNSYTQTQTMGVFINDTANTFKGYTLFAPKQYTKTYLINNEGKKIHEWVKSAYAPGQAVYLLENGNLLRACMTQGNLGTGGGEGGRIEEYDWNDSLVWSMDYSTSTYMQHHDIKKLPNGNIIMLVVEKKMMSEIIAAGFDTSNFQPDVHQKGFILPDAVVEIQPTYPTGGIVVWQWHVWDHLIQNRDATKNNYGVPSAHPELIDVLGDHKVLPLFWNHMNSIDYNPTLDQIALSVRGNSEVWIIDHSTTTAQAATHTGGAHNKGGDLLYRWGNPICYGAGTVSSGKYFQQHDVEWIKTGCPGAGDLLCFNDGVSRNYSSIDQITTPVDGSGNYAYVTGSAYAPTNLTWTYQATPPTSMYATEISGAQRLPNGNTIICSGPTGTLYEVTAAGQVAWKYIDPVTNTGPLHQGDSIPSNPVRPGETMNSIFRVYKYAPTYAAFTGKTLTPGSVIELTPTSVSEISNQTQILQVYPNPFTDRISINNATGKETYELLNSIGQSVWSGGEISQKDFSYLVSGLYILKINSQNTVQTLKLIKK